MEWIKQNLRWIVIAAVAIVGLCVLSYIGGCASGSKDGYADGYKQGLEDSKCDGGSHTRPWSQPKK